MKLSEQIIYDYAISFVGKPYIWGGDDPILGFDCSGLCIEILTAAGVFPRGLDVTALGLYGYFPEEPSQPKFGTLVFFGKEKITHVGFCLNDSYMLEAGAGGSQTTNADAAAKQNAFIRIRRINSRKDICGYKHPSYAWE